MHSQCAEGPQKLRTETITLQIVQIVDRKSETKVEKTSKRRYRQAENGEKVEQQSQTNRNGEKRKNLLHIFRLLTTTYIVHTGCTLAETRLLNLIGLQTDWLGAHRRNSADFAHLKLQFKLFWPKLTSEVTTFLQIETRLSKIGCTRNQIVQNWLHQKQAL